MRAENALTLLVTPGQPGVVTRKIPDRTGGNTRFAVRLIARTSRRQATGSRRHLLFKKGHLRKMHRRRPRRSRQKPRGLFGRRGALRELARRELKATATAFFNKCEDDDVDNWLAGDADRSWAKWHRSTERQEGVVMFKLSIMKFIFTETYGRMTREREADVRKFMRQFRGADGPAREAADRLVDALFARGNGKVKNAKQRSVLLSNQGQRGLKTQQFEGSPEKLQGAAEGSEYVATIATDEPVISEADRPVFASGDIRGTELIWRRPGFFEQLFSIFLGSPGPLSAAQREDGVFQNRLSRRSGGGRFAPRGARF